MGDRVCPYCGQPGDGEICMNCGDKYEKSVEEKEMTTIKPNQLESAQVYGDHSDCPICNPIRIICAICRKEFTPEFYGDEICGKCQKNFDDELASRS